MSGATYDVAVIGAGLAGLVSAIQLAQNGRRVVILERQPRVGGLCGVDEQDGCTFTIACNDFGRGMINLLAKIGVQTEFKKKETHIYYENEVFKAPLDGNFLMKLLRSPVQASRLFYGVLCTRFGDGSVNTLGEFSKRFLVPGRVRDIVEIPAYLMGTCPEDFALSYLRYETEFRYNYNESGVPVGGPQQLADDLLQRCRSLGITVQTGWHVNQCIRITDSYEIHADQGKVTSTILVDTRERHNAYPAKVKRGLELCQIRMVLDGYKGFDSKIHTYLYYPKKSGDAMRQLDMGGWVNEFPFHLFKNDYPQPNGLTTVNLYFYLPRGVREIPHEKQTWLVRRIFERADQLIPGFEVSLKQWHMFTPHDFEDRFGMSPCVMPFIWQGEKPDNFDPESGFYYAGHTVYPPGDHAGAAVLSGYKVANLILEEQTL
jgi:phytoene dehydrogenase-like protein